MRYLLGNEINRLPAESAEVVVVGSGVSGLRTALSLSEEYTVTVITKSEIKDSNTNWAQGGIAAVLDEADSSESHLEDTLEAGDGLCDRDRVRELVETGPDEVRQLIDWGADFDRTEEGELDFGREGGHSTSRIVHGRGDATGSLVEDTLVDQVRRNPKITVYEETMMVDLLADEDRAYGMIVRTPDSFELLWLRGLVLATGGLGQLYRETTNHDVVTGDGMAAALRAGLPLQDMEFVQFHPTTLYVAGGPRFLISEAVRGAGAKLLDEEGNRFMTDVHPMEELAPRDVVSRAILRRMIETETECVYLNATGLSEEQLNEEFPTISRTCREYGIDPAFDRIPVRPCAHYTMGGIRTDLGGGTDRKNVYAVGEVSCTGIHGANRLASNSLLEGLVMGRRIIETFRDDELPPLQERRPEFDRVTRERRLNIPDMKRSLKSLMWRRVGILRKGEELRKARDQISEWLALFARHQISTRDEIELANMLMMGRCITETALKREESRGAHYRDDFPELKDSFRRHSLIDHTDWNVRFRER